MHELDYSSRNLMCTASSALLHPARVPDSIRIATLRAAYDSPGVTAVATDHLEHAVVLVGLK